MRVVSFVADGRPSFGLAVDDGIVDSGARLGDVGDLFELLQSGRLEELRADEAAAADFGFDEVRFLPVIANPAAKILCIGINYRPHMLEMGREPPSHPVVFVRFSNSLVGHDEPLIRPTVSEKFDFEGELAVIIGKRARQVSRAEALDHVAGFACFNDGSVRDFQRHSGQFTPGKNFVASGSLGPWMATRDEIPNPAALELTTRLNGEVVQQESTGELIFGIAELIEYITIWTELMPGDIIATGTPGGVGAGRTPPLWMRPGDRVEVEISGVGSLRNEVRERDAS
ncbi:MAG: fumarylacetoacetate hydrolase family protein [Gammaproteobacteria bacterium]|jgi:2-keto-4-pentenoate hydratase/2-oxohepta-3-ene-1,7-dioic acid hydratase in catechol pathway